MPHTLPRVLATAALLAVADGFAVTPHARAPSSTRAMRIGPVVASDGGEAVPDASAPPADGAAAASPGRTLYPPRTEMELAEQSAKLDALAAKWKRRREEKEYQLSLIHI